MTLTRRHMLKLSAAAAACAAGGLVLPNRARTDDDLSGFFKFPETGINHPPPLLDPPEKIVDQGLIRCGLFKSPVRTMNLLESNSLSGRAKNWLGLPRLMEWVGAGMTHPDWYFGFIIVNAQAASLAVLYGYCRRTGFYFSHDAFGPKSRVHVAESTWHDITSIHKRGYDMEAVHRLDQGFHKLSIDIAGSGNKPPISADLVWHEDLAATQPLVLMAPLAGNGFMYNHKAPMFIEGAMKINDERITFDPSRDLAILDDLKTFGGSGSGLKFSWSNFGGVGLDINGRVIGLNSAHSPQKPNPCWDENYIWAGKSLTKVSPILYDVDKKDVTRPWRIHDQDGRVDMNFFPEGGKTVAFPLIGQYHQKCGTFEGTLIDGSGERHEFKDFYGAGEYADIL